MVLTVREEIKTKQMPFKDHDKKKKLKNQYIKCYILLMN